MLSKEVGEFCVKLAKDSINNYLKERKVLGLPKGVPRELLDKKAGVFVTLYDVSEEKKELRGCIGTFLPAQDNIAEEIIHNAISAAFSDPRFLPLSSVELPKIKIEVSILSTPEKIKSKDKLDPKKYGVIISTSDGRRGLLLPGIEGVDTVDQQLMIVSQKGGIDIKADQIQLERFTVDKYE